jgi:UDP-3-O-[3-hydroxymyristoyl] glucosamine N-acyltransferase
VKPGRHPAVSLVTLFWLLAGGISTWSWRLMLPFVPMTFLSQMFYRIAGCRMGRDVYVNTLEVNDPYLVTIGEGSVIGGGAVISPHVFEAGRLTLAPVVIGKNCLIGAEAYLSPGVTIGDGSVIGLRVHLRKDTKIPPGSHILDLAGMDPHRVYEIERGRRTKEE